QTFLCLPAGVDNRFVGSRRELSSFDKPYAGYRLVFIETNAIDNAFARVVVRSIDRVLSNADRVRNAVHGFDLADRVFRKPKGFGAAHSDRTRSAKKYFGADVRLARCLFADRTIREPDRENDQQNADRNAEYAHD